MLVRELIKTLQSMPQEAELLFDLGEEFSGINRIEESDPRGAVILYGDQYLYDDQQFFVDGRDSFAEGREAAADAKPRRIPGDIPAGEARKEWLDGFDSWGAAPSR